jgi:hypothetical protein
MKILQCVFTSLVAMQKKDLTRKLVIVFHIRFPFVH